jgi:hypothetical protein
MMIEISVIRDLVAIFGVIAGFSYYVLTVRNQQKSQRLAEETRQLQIITELAGRADVEGSKIFIELLNMEWTDYNDFEMKYGSDNNPDNYAKRTAFSGQIRAMGLMLRRGLVDRDLLFETMGWLPYLYWMKFKENWAESEKRYGTPQTGETEEWLAKECIKWYEEKGVRLQVPETFYKYIPDQ